MCITAASPSRCRCGNAQSTSFKPRSTALPAQSKKGTDAGFRIATSSRSRLFSAFNRRISACSSVDCPSRFPASISAWTTHRRSDSAPAPSCRATAAIAFAFEDYSARCSSTSLTARSRTSELINFGMTPSFQLKRKRHQTLDDSQVNELQSLNVIHMKMWLGNLAALREDM